MNTSIVWRATSALLLAAALAVIFWLTPGLEPHMIAPNTDGTIVYGGLFAIFWLYLVVQGYPIAFGRIGSTSTHTFDSIISVAPAFVALFGIILKFMGFVQLSAFNLVIAVMTLLVAVYDIWVIGGAAAQINRLTPETKIVH